MSWGGDNTENITFHIAYRFQTHRSESENLKIKGEYLELLILSAWRSLQETPQHGWARTLRRMWGFCKRTNDSLKRLNVCYLLWETHWGGRRGCWTALHPAAALFKPVRPGGACRCVQVCASARCDECVVYLLLHTTGSGTLLTSCWTPKRFSQTDALHYCWSMLDLLICPLLISGHQHTLRQCVCLWPVSPCLIVQSGCLHQLLTQTKGVRIHVSHSHIQLVNPPVSTLESIGSSRVTWLAFMGELREAFWPVCGSKLLPRVISVSSWGQWRQLSRLWGVQVAPWRVVILTMWLPLIRLRTK